jgi:hypothetical protein
METPPGKPKLSKKLIIEIVLMVAIAIGLTLYLRRSITQALNEDESATSQEILEPIRK